MVSIVPTVVEPVVPSMFWAIVGVFTAVVYVVASENTPRMLSDLLSDAWMLLKEFFNFLMFVEIFAVVDQLRVRL